MATQSKIASHEDVWAGAPRAGPPAPAEGMAPYASLPSLLILTTVIIGTSTVLAAGWGLGLESFTRLSPGLPAMVPSTALSFLLAATALIAWHWPERRRRPALRVAIGSFVIMLATINLLIGISGVAFGIDQLLFPQVPAFATEKMSSATSACFILAGFCLVRLARPRRADRPLIITASLGLAIGVLAMMTFAFDVQALYSVAPFAQLSIHTAACFVAIFAFILLARRNFGWMAILMGPGVGSSSARRSLPTVLGATLVLSLLVQVGVRDAYFEPEFGISLLAICMTIMLAFAILREAHATNLREQRHTAEIERMARGWAVETACQTSADNFENLAEALPIAMYRADASQRICYANRALAELAGKQPEQLLGMPVEQLVHKRGNRLGSPCEFPGPKSGPTEDVLIAAGDNELWARAVSRPFQLPGNSNPGTVGTLVDLTDYHLAMRDLCEARDKAEAAARAKSSFLANMSHEIRTPMNGVLGFAQMLLESDLPEEQRQFAQMIQDSGESLVRILNDILDLSKIETGKMTVQDAEFDLRLSVESTMKLMRAVAVQKGIGLEQHIDRAVPLLVHGDELRLGQVLSNLLGNAVKFTDTGEVRLEVSLEESGLVRFTVSDTGIGIAPDRIEAIFEEFTQSDNSTARRYGGTGLGLPICRKLTELMGGTLTLESREGSGTTALLELPLAG